MRSLVLLLPVKLEAFDQRALVEELLEGEGVVAVDPPRTSYTRIARVPDALGVSIAHKQARRLRKRLPAEPRAVAIFHPAQYPLARGLLAQIRDCELWYGRAGRPEAEAEARARERLSELHRLAAERSALTFVTDNALGREEAEAGRRAVFVGDDTTPLWERLVKLDLSSRRGPEAVRHGAGR